MKFALNHITTPNLSVRELIRLASKLGFHGVELRNDLASKGLTDASFLNGETPEEIRALADDHGIVLLGLSEVYGFNDWSQSISTKISTLVDQAVSCGAKTITLIPLNHGYCEDIEERTGALTYALNQTKRIIDGSPLKVLIEPLGFGPSSLYLKSEAIAAIEAVDGLHCFQLVHDTFHHFLAEEEAMFPRQTGMVHISGLTHKNLMPENMSDAHRGLIDAQDRLGNLKQIASLHDGGYAGAFSFEVFSPDVHAHHDIETALRQSVDIITRSIV